MGIRGALLILAIAGLFSGVRNAGAQGQTAPPLDRAAMTDQLITHTVDRYSENLQLAKTRPDETFAVIQAHWDEIPYSAEKITLLTMIERSDNPHLLEMLDLAVNDRFPGVQDACYRLLHNLAFRNFTNDPMGYRTWRQEVAGKPLADVVANGCTAFVTQFLQADDAQRSSLYKVLAELDFRPITKLGQVRRSAVCAAGLPEGLMKALATLPANSPNIAYTQLSFQVVGSLQPDEAFIKRLVAPLTAKDRPSPVRREAASLLRTVHATWAAQQWFDIMTENLSHTDRMLLLMGAGQSKNPYLIPPLIGLLEAGEAPEAKPFLEIALLEITKITTDDNRDGDWWHEWWDSNKKRFPQDLQAVAIPQVPAEGGAFYVRRHKERQLLEGDPQRAYRLLCPASLTQSAGRNASPQKQTFGLIVVLADDMSDGDELAAFWQKAIRQSLQDGYFVALPVAPKWNTHQPAVWLTQRNVHQVEEARFSTEDFLNDIVTDVKRRYPIHPGHVFLHGIGTGGLAAYACSLNAMTPFKGFYLLSSPFKTAQLPALTAARGRRYLIQQSTEDRVTPYFLAKAADELLRKQSAVVKLVVTKGEHGYQFDPAPWEQIHQAITWLETSP